MLWTLLIGLLVGIVAKFLMPGKDPGGFIVTIVIGVLGSAIAGWLGLQAGFYHEGEAVGFIASVFGAIILLFVYRLISGRRA